MGPRDDPDSQERWLSQGKEAGRYRSRALDRQYNNLLAH